MQLNVELIPDEEQGGFTATIPDIPAYGEGDTEAAAIEDLKEALRLYIEGAIKRDRSNIDRVRACR